MAVGLRPGGPRGVADEIRELLADDAERRAFELLPEGSELRGDREPGEVESPPRRPHESLPLAVAEHPTAKGHPLEDAADELAVLASLGSGELRAELVELPGIDDDAVGAGMADRVAVATAELDSPGRALCGREPQESRLVGDASCEPAADLALLVGRESPTLPGLGADLGLEHGRVTALSIRVDGDARLSVHAVAADMDADAGGHAGAGDRVHQPRQVVELEVGKEGGSDGH